MVWDWSNLLLNLLGITGFGHIISPHTALIPYKKWKKNLSQSFQQYDFSSRDSCRRMYSDNMLFG